MGFGAAEADDLVQDAFVTFLETMDRFEGRARVSTWLHGILHHKAQERRRARTRDELVDPIDDVFEARFAADGRWSQPPVAPDRALASDEIAAALAECLDRLSPLQRDVFALRQIQELPAETVSKIVGRTVTHVGVLFHRARGHLRTCLEEKGWKASR